MKANLLILILLASLLTGYVRQKGQMITSYGALTNGKQTFQ